MGQDTGGIDLLKEVNGHPQIHIANAVDGQANTVLARIKYAILAGAIVLELQQIVAIVKGIHILGLTGIDKFLFHNQVISFI